MNSKRLKRINNEIQRIISSSIINGVKDPRIDRINTTITSVDVTNDLSFATIYVSIIGTDSVKKETLEALERASGYFKKEISNNMELRHIPKLIFKLDETTEHGMYIDTIINKIKSENE